VIGRREEIAAVETSLDSLEAGPAALYVSGEPGIGKSTLWRAGVSAARSRSYRVMLSRPAETEAGLSFVALADLLESVPQEAVASLPGPQRRALEIALRLDGAAEQLDRVALARGALSVISRVASDRPTVIAIDDAQWLDAPSRDALRFVFRRLVDVRVGLFATVRGEAASGPLDIDAALTPERITRLVLGPLSPAELESVVRSHRDISLSPPSWRAVYRVSGGNPFFALQIAEAVTRKGGLAPGETPPLPESVTQAVQDRLAWLSAAARRTLLYAAALAKPTAALLHAAEADGGLREALEASVLEREGDCDQLRFTHPLLAAALYGGASTEVRSDAHRVLGELVEDPVERALHLGRGYDEPDERVAATLEAAADRAAGRGVPETASELAAHAERLTPASRVEDSSRRAIQAARYAGRAGDLGRTVEIVGRLVATLPAGRPRAGALALLGFMLQDEATLLRAVEEAGGDSALLAVVHADLSMIELRRGEREAAVAHARAALSAARASGDAAALVRALTARALPKAHGRAERALALLDEATELERALKEPLSLINSPSTWQGAVLLNADRFEAAREALEDAYQRGLALGHASRALPLTYLVELECRAGNWNRALTYSLEAEAVWAGTRGEAWTLVGRAVIEAHLGNVEIARAVARQSIGLTRGRNLVTLARTEAALGMLELSHGNWRVALELLEPFVALLEGEPLRDAVAFRACADAVEALLGLGRPAAAKELTERLERHARSVDLPSWEAAAFRCRALVLAALGDVSGARTAISHALTVHAGHHEPFEHARTLLSAGAIERRAKRKAEARSALEQAEAAFERLGARLWLERARRELERTGVRRAAAAEELSAAERQVADLAAAGATNKEIAAALYMSVKTVEAHLTRVYRKLDVRSRAELGSRLVSVTASSRRDDPR
jgi:DNA-binding CsgD family transcriptional regulator